MGLESQLSWGKASELQFIFKALISCLRFVWLSKEGGEQWFSWWLHGCVVYDFDFAKFLSFQNLIKKNLIVW